MTAIKHARILVVSADGFEQSELEGPRDQLRAKGATVEIATPSGQPVTGWDENNWGCEVSADISLQHVATEKFDALVLPGGQINPDLLRLDKDALRVIKEMYDAGKVIGAICHAPWLLVEIDALKGRRATSFHSIKTDLENAGAYWEDSAAVVDAGLITSRSPEDIDAFVSAIVDEIESDAPVYRAA